MNKLLLLHEAITKIAQRAGIVSPLFHLTSVSQDAAGVFIMQTVWPEGRLLCEALARSVSAFPQDAYTTCIALLPDLIEEIIWVARDNERNTGNDATRENGL